MENKEVEKYISIKLNESIEEFEVGDTLLFDRTVEPKNTNKRNGIVLLETGEVELFNAQYNIIATATHKYYSFV